jgi:hypothetical protein
VNAVGTAPAVDTNVEVPVLANAEVTVLAMVALPVLTTVHPSVTVAAGQ